MNNKTRINAAFFASGRGSNFEAVLSHVLEGSLDINISFFLSNNSKSRSIQTARDNNIPAYHVSTRTHGDDEGVASEMIRLIDEHSVDLLVLAGYMKKIPDRVLQKLPNRVINIHPALLPAFGGEGWYGHHVHEGVIRHGCQYSGITIHLVNGIYDKGRIILQRSVDVKAGDTADELGACVLKVEHQWLWRVIKGFAEGVLKPCDDRLEGIDEFRRGVQGL